jgi:hypothetical protein
MTLKARRVLASDRRGPVALARFTEARRWAATEESPGMSLFVNFEDLDPYVLFGAVLRRSRLSMQAAYEASFAAYLRCIRLLEDYRFGSAPRFGPLGFPVFAQTEGDLPQISPAELDAMWSDAIAEDFQADHQAAPVILTADDALQRFAKGVRGKGPGLNPGFGQKFGSTSTPVHLTTLLRAGTNTLRHVSEWVDNPELRGPHGDQPGEPYPDPAHLQRGSTAWLAMENISVLRRAFGIGKSDPINQVVSFRVLAAVDREIPNPSYDRFAAAVLEAARDIARQGPSDALPRLEAALTRSS